MKTLNFFLILFCIGLTMKCQSQTFKYFDVLNLKSIAILTPKNHVLLPIRPANEFNVYGIKDQTALNNQFEKHLRSVFPAPDSALIQLLDSVTYKSVFRKDLKIYYCEYQVPPKVLPSIQKMEDKLFQFFLETQKIDLAPYISIDTLRFEQSNCTQFKLSRWLK